MAPAAFLHFGEDPVWVYVSIPFAAALVGWLTKLLAVWMMFNPVEFKGIRPIFGWQGQIPKRAAKMAGIAVDSITAELLKPEELFDRIDPDDLARELEGPLHDAVADIVETIMVEYQPRLWNTMPQVARRAVIANVQRRAPEAARNLMDQVRENLDQVFDIKHMVVSNLVRDKHALNRMFKTLGDDAFAFIIRSGIYFGFYIGLIQAAVFGITGRHLVLPLFGLLVGGLTDYIALTMIFRPKQERRLAPGIRWQGLFHNRRDKATRLYAEVLAKDMFTPAAVFESLLTGPMSDRFYELINEEIERTIDQQAGLAGRFVSIAVGGRRYQAMKQTIATKVIERLPETSQHIEVYAAEALDIENTIVEKMSQMDADTYENLLRPVFKDDEWIVVALGATLGFLFGELQVQLITALA